MVDHPHYTAAQIIEAIRGTRGIKAAIARKLGCHRDTVDSYLKRYTTAADAYWHERQEIVDTAEVQLLVKLNEGDGPTIRFVLATLGKDRGYVERHEVATKDDEPLKIQASTDDKLLATLEKLTGAIITGTSG